MDAAHSPTLVVLAAGMGSRFGGLKQLAPVGPNDEFILDYTVFDAWRGGFGQVVFVIREELEAEFDQAIGKRFADVLPVSYAYQQLADLPAGFSVPSERVKPWGTGHALRAARDAVQTPCCVVNADDYYGPDAYRIMASHLSQNNPNYALVGYDLKHTLSESGTVSRGLCRAENQVLVQIEERHGICRSPNGGLQSELDGAVVALPDDQVVSMNFWGFPSRVFAQLEPQFVAFLEAGAEGEFYLPAIAEAEMTAGNRVELLGVSSDWTGVTYASDQEAVRELLRGKHAAGVYPEVLFPS